MYQLTIERNFSAAHMMRDHPDICSRFHGHNYRVLLTVEGDTLDDTGMLIDFAVLKRIFGSIVDRLDHRNLNEIPPFDEMNPSSENLARYFYEQTDSQLPDAVRISAVTVYESTTSCVTYRGAGRGCGA